MPEFSKWRQLYKNYVTVSEAHEQASHIALRSFFSELQDVVKHILLVLIDTVLDTSAILEEFQNYIRSQRNITSIVLLLKSANSFISRAPIETFQATPDIGAKVSAIGI